jgi:polyphosphate glucokinase
MAEAPFASTTPARRLIGVDVGGSGIKAALVDVEQGTWFDRVRVATPQPATPDAIASEIGKLIEPFGVDGAVGCTLPGVVLDGVVRSAAHIDPKWIGTDAVELLSSKLGRPCAVLNDADAAGLAEARYGAGRGERGLIAMITIGTGVGVALVNDGVLVPNCELGHIEIDGMVADDWVSDAARTRDDLSWKKWTKRFNVYLSTLHDLMWPRVVVIGGGVVKHADKFRDDLDAPCDVRLAELGNRAGIVGAAYMAAKE